MNITELKPFQKKVSVTGKVLEVKEAREVTSKLDNSTHKVTEAVLADTTGSILLTLWDEKINAFQTGKAYEIENAFTSLFKNSIRLNIGRYGTAKGATQELTNAKEDNNISEKEYDMKTKSFK